MARDIDPDSGRPFIKINHPAPGDMVRNPAHVAGYGTAFEGVISLVMSRSAVRVRSSAPFFTCKTSRNEKPTMLVSEALSAVRQQ